MKLFVAAEESSADTPVRYFDDVNLVIFCAERIEDWGDIATMFNNLKIAALYFNLSIDITDNWEVREIGETTLFNGPTIIEYTVADSG